MGTIAARSLSPSKLTELVVVGKDVVELLSSAMYVDPLTIYREYIQNAADAIDEAEAAGLYTKDSRPRIDIVVDASKRRIRIRDNGVGVSVTTFQRRLTALGASPKRGKYARGFRGVGRLSGLAYCQELIFRSKSENDRHACEVRWDCQRLRELLIDKSFKGDVNDLVYEITRFNVVSPDSYLAHFFEVELLDVKRVRSDILLNESATRRYLSQVAPVPFARGFSFAGRITKHLSKYSTGKTYNLYLNNDTARVERPLTNSFAAKQTQKDKFSEFEAFEIAGVNGGVDAVGWLLHHNYYGALPEHLGIRGLRLRLGNMQIGHEDIFQTVFPEPRFNSWCVGEVHLITPHLIPNGRRDDLEQNVHQQNLMNHVTPLAKRIAKLCREKSAERHRATNHGSPPILALLTRFQRDRLALCRAEIAATIQKILPILASSGFRGKRRIVDALLKGAEGTRRRVKDS